MRKSLAILTVGSALALGACATSPYGSQYGGYGSPYGGMGGPLEAVLGTVLGAAGSSSYGYGNQGYYGGGGNFQQAAVNACGNAASRYGQVSIRDVRQISRDTLRVYGLIGSAYRTNDFECNFRSDGRITDFDI
jgi:hypothetical protein